MAAGVPMYKGMGFWPVIVSLKTHPRGRLEVPATLQHYLDDDVVVTGWYPEQDFLELLECLARVLELDGMSDIWTYFGRVAAQRDLKGEQNLIPEERRVGVAGIYRRLASDEELSFASWLTRVGKIWSLYHDTGRIVTGRSATHSDGAVFRLYDFPIVLPAHIAHMHTEYYSEFARIAKQPVTVHFVCHAPGPNGYHEWEVVAVSNSEIATSLATLPKLR